jgi:hypothetical protein
MFNTTPSATNVLAIKANLKLRQEASLKEYRLRFLVCHANMLDAISLSLADMQFCQVGSAKSTLTEASLHKSSVAMSSADENTFDAEVESQEQKNAPTDGMINNGEILINTPGCTDELVAEIGYDLERTPSRQIDTIPNGSTRLQATSSGSEDELVSNNGRILPSPHVSFEDLFS